MTDTLIAYLASFLYAQYAILAAIIALSGYLVPLPEEIVLLVSGYLISLGVFDAAPAFLTCFLALYAGDYLLYALTYGGSRRMAKLRARIERSAFGRRRLAEPGRIGPTVFLLRFIVGLRFMGPVIAGVARVPAAAFLVYDGLALIVYVAALLSFGYYAYDSVLPVFTDIAGAQHAIFAVALVALAAYIFFRAHRTLRA